MPKRFHLIVYLILCNLLVVMGMNPLGISLLPIPISVLPFNLEFPYFSRIIFPIKAILGLVGPLSRLNLFPSGSVIFYFINQQVHITMIIYLRHEDFCYDVGSHDFRIAICIFNFVPSALKYRIITRFSSWFLIIVYGFLFKPSQIVILPYLLC